MRPVESKYKVTCPYGKRGSMWTAGFHKGIDFGTPIGIPVVAAVSGIVTDNHWGRAFGKHVVIKNDKFADGSSGLWAGYCHLSKIKVVPGQRVRKGQIIGWSGASGNVTGAHLHFEVQKGAYWNAYRSVNPDKWVRA